MNIKMYDHRYDSDDITISDVTIIDSPSIDDVNHYVSIKLSCRVSNSFIDVSKSFNKPSSQQK